MSDRMKLTDEHKRDLRAIDGQPGIYHKVPPGTSQELYDLCERGLIVWRRQRGYQITEAGRSALAEERKT